MTKNRHDEHGSSGFFIRLGWGVRVTVRHGVRAHSRYGPTV